MQTRTGAGRRTGDAPIRPTATSATTRTPSWSPDGAKIAWGRNTFDPEVCVCFLGSSVYVMNANGSGQTSIISGQEPAWSPDGQKIVFRDRITTWDECPPAGFAQCRISVINPDGSGRQTIRNGGGEPDPAAPH